MFRSEALPSEVLGPNFEAKQQLRKKENYDHRQSFAEW